MNNITQIKNKYIIYNNRNEILVLNNDKNRIFVPSLIENQINDSYGEIIKDLIDLLKTKSELVYLGNIIEEFPAFKAQNNKLKKYILEETKNYFSCYIENMDDLNSQIMKLCYKEGIMPYLISIEELKQLIEKRYKKGIRIDKNLLQQLDELDKRLSLKKY